MDATRPFCSFELSWATNTRSSGCHKNGAPQPHKLLPPIYPFTNPASTISHMQGKPSSSTMRLPCILIACSILSFSQAFLPQASKCHLRSSTSLFVQQDTDNISVNPLVANVKVSKTVEIFSLVKQMQAEGQQVTSLCVGEPDFLPSPVILEAAVQAVKDVDTRYTAVTGTAATSKCHCTRFTETKGSYL